MKPFEIALFKHFLVEKGMATVWINMYRRNHLEKNPASVEEFLKNADPANVCTRAFRFFINSDYGYDYWNRMSELWLEFLEANANNYTAEEWYKLTGMSKILRTNWDAAKHWKEETKLTAAIRLGIDLSLIGAENKTPTTPPTKLSEEYLREKTLKEFNESVKADTPDRKESVDAKTDEATPSATGGIFGEFELMSLRPKTTEKRRLRSNEISINTRNNRSRITFSQEITKDIKGRGGYEYASLLRNKKGEVMLLLNDTDRNGATLLDGGRARENNNAAINSAVLVEKIKTLLNIDNDYEIIRATLVEKTNDYAAYLLTSKD